MNMIAHPNTRQFPTNRTRTHLRTVDLTHVARLLASHISQALAALVSCVEWGARVGLSDLRGHLGAGPEAAGCLLPRGAEGLVTMGAGRDRQGRPLVIVRLGRLTASLVESCGRRPPLRFVRPIVFICLFCWGFCIFLVVLSDRRRYAGKGMGVQGGAGITKGGTFLARDDIT